MAGFKTCNQTLDQTERRNNHLGRDVQILEPKEKKHFIPQWSTNWYEKKKISLWSSHIIHREQSINGYMSRAHKAPREDGLLILADVMHPDNGLQKWVTLSVHS